MRDPSQKNKIETSIAPLVNTASFVKDTTIDFYYFTMKVPSGWRKANDDTLPKMPDATFRQRLHNKKNKLIYVAAGLSAFDLSDSANTLPKNQKIHYEQISGRNTKIFEPIKFGQGLSGIYIDSIDDIAGNVASLSIYGKNLDSGENSELVKIIRTMKLKPKPF